MDRYWEPRSFPLNNRDHDLKCCFTGINHGKGNRGNPITSVCSGPSKGEMVLENDEEYIHIKVVQELEYGQLKRRSVRYILISDDQGDYND